MLSVNFARRLAETQNRKNVSLPCLGWGAAAGASMFKFGTLKIRHALQIRTPISGLT